MTYTTVSKLLPTLAPADLKKVRDRCNALLGSVVLEAPAEKGKLIKPEPSDWYAAAVKRYALKRGWFNSKEINIALSQKALAHLPEYIIQSRHVRAHLEARLGLRLRFDQLIAVGDIAVQALVLFYERTNEWRSRQMQTPISIDIKLLMAKIDRLPEAIEMQLPGYLANGMLGLVVRSHGGPSVKSF